MFGTKCTQGVKTKYFLTYLLFNRLRNSDEYRNLLEAIVMLAGDIPQDGRALLLQAQQHLSSEIATVFDSVAELLMNHTKTQVFSQVVEYTGLL